MCDTYEPPRVLPDGSVTPLKPIPTNTRAACAEVRAGRIWGVSGLLNAGPGHVGAWLLQPGRASVLRGLRPCPPVVHPGL